MDRGFYKLVDYALALLGFFLIMDSLYMHRIVFNYKSLGLAWLDPWFNHWMIGVALIAFAWWDLRRISE
jgi:hypothetical protein